MSSMERGLAKIYRRSGMAAREAESASRRLAKKTQHAPKRRVARVPTGKAMSPKTLPAMLRYAFANDAPRPGEAMP
jgi:hypothetical protein